MFKRKELENSDNNNGPEKKTKLSPASSATNPGKHPTLTEYDTLLRNLVNEERKQGGNNQIFSQKVDEAFTALNLCAQTATNNHNLNSDALSYIVYNCAQLAKYSQVSIKIEVLELILLHLSVLVTINPKAIANSFYGIGLLTKHSRLRGVLSTPVVQELFNHLTNIHNISAINISLSLYGLGLIAEAKQLQVNIDAKTVQQLLQRLLGMDQIVAQNFNNSFQGIRSLAKSKQLQGKIEAPVVQSLLERLANFRNVDVPSLSITLQSIGSLAHFGHLNGTIQTTVVQKLLTNLSNLADLEIQGISNSIYGIGLLAESNQLQGTTLDTAKLQSLLDKTASLRNIDMQGISNILYGIGLIAQGGHLNIKIEANTVQLLLNRSINLRDISAQGLSNSLYGVGLLAQAGRLNGKIDARTAEQFLESFVNNNEKIFLGITMSLYGLGLIAQENQLQNTIQASIINLLLNHLTNQKSIDGQTINNSLYGIGLLAKANVLQGSVDAINVQILIERLGNSSDIYEQSISNSVYSIGLLAQTDKLNDSLEAKPIQKLVERFTALRDVKTLSISNIFFGLAHVAKANKLQGKISARCVQDLLQQLANQGDADAQAIGISLYSLGFINLDAEIDAQTVQNLMNLLQNHSSIDAQSISNCLYGVGLQAQAGYLQGMIDAQKVQTLLMSLISCTTYIGQDINNSLYGIGLLAKAGQLEGSIEADKIQTLLEHLLGLSVATKQDICTSLYGIGTLAKAKQLHGHLKAIPLQKLLERITNLSNLDTLGISNCFYGLGMLVKSQQVENPTVLIKTIENLLEALKTRAITETEAHQILLGLAEFLPMVRCDAVVLNKLLTSIMNQSYVHPKEVVALIHYFALFKDKYAELDETFRTLLPFINLSLHQFPLNHQRQLVQYIAQLEQTSDWAKALKTRFGLVSNPAPEFDFDQPSEPITHPAPIQKTTNTQPKQVKTNTINLDSAWTRACNNQIFKAIADKDKNKLARLLGIFATTPIQQFKPASGNQHQTNIARSNTSSDQNNRPRHENSADALVREFLRQTPALALRQLIERSNSGYFELLLKACSQHLRYQLAIDNALHPILLYLPEAALKPMVETLLALGLYRDHKALLKLVDALTIRRLEQAQSAGLITQLENQLIDRCLTFHQDTKHRHVVPRIQAYKQHLAKANASFIDDDLSTQDIPTAINAPIENQTKARVSQTGLFAANTSRFTANSAYQYVTEDIQAILAERVRSFPDASVLTAAKVSEHDEGNSVYQVLNQFLTGAEGQRALSSTEKRNLILPILINNNHWIGIRLQLNRNQAPIITYYNSLIKEDTDTELQVTLLTDISRALRGKGLAQNPRLTLCKNCLQQDDATSCGAYFIENVYCDLKNQGWKQMPNLTQEIRLRHLRLLRETRVDYFPGFNQRQLENNPINFVTSHAI